MLEFKNNPQGGETWLDRRAGKFTASRAKELMTNGDAIYLINEEVLRSSEIDAYLEGLLKVNPPTVETVKSTVPFECEVTEDKGKIWVWADGKKMNPYVKTGRSQIASMVASKIEPDSYDLSTTAKNYVLEVAVEMLHGKDISTFGGNDATEWGHEYEDEAIARYKGVGNVDVTPCDFVEHFDHDYAGGSPDGLVDSEGLVEVKCPYNAVKHIRNVLYDDFVKDYEWQCHWNMWCTHRKWCDLISYDPRLKDKGKDIHIVRIERDESIIQAIEVRYAQAVSLLNHYLKVLEYE